MQLLCKLKFRQNNVRTFSQIQRPCFYFTLTCGVKYPCLLIYYDRALLWGWFFSLFSRSSFGHIKHISWPTFFFFYPLSPQQFFFFWKQHLFDISNLRVYIAGHELYLWNLCRMCVILALLSWIWDTFEVLWGRFHYATNHLESSKLSSTTYCGEAGLAKVSVIAQVLVLEPCHLLLLRLICLLFLPVIAKYPDLSLNSLIITKSSSWVEIRVWIWIMVTVWSLSKMRRKYFLKWVYSWRLWPVFRTMRPTICSWFFSSLLCQALWPSSSDISPKPFSQCSIGNNVALLTFLSSHFQYPKALSVLLNSFLLTLFQKSFLSGIFSIVISLWHFLICSFVLLIWFWFFLYWSCIVSFSTYYFNNLSYSLYCFK